MDKYSSRRKFIKDSAKAITFASTVGFNLPQAVFGNNPLYGNDKHHLLFMKQIDPETTRKTFQELTVDVPPEKLYQYFNDFCLTHFGAEVDPVTYGTFGRKLEIKESSKWSHYSESSAAIAWSTNLPARTYIEYGTEKYYGHKTTFSERYFYTHLHYLKNLEPDTLYHYRLVSVDERGNRTESGDQSFQTKKIPKAIHVPGNLGNPPYILDQPDAIYLITEDINAPRTAFSIEADNITIDLGGNTVTHGNELITDLDYQKLSTSGIGIRKIGGRKQSGLRILNGKLLQGKAENNLEYYAAENMVRPEAGRKKKLAKNSSRGFSNIEITDYENVEIAGLTAEYRWHQTWGVRFDRAFGNYDIHHNIIIDKGNQMFNRHGDGGSRSIGFRAMVESQGSIMQIHHNLIKRTRQNGLSGARHVYENEIYVDSWVVNSFAISPFKVGSEIKKNKIFLTGYYGCGIVWAERDLDASNNYIHMESVNTMKEPPNEGRRLIETWGEQDVLIGMRLTNYGKGGQPREDFIYSKNVILGRSRGDVIMRGVALYSDRSVKNFLLQNNTIKVFSEDNIVEKAACVVAQGANNDRSEHLPMYYRDSVLESNICNIRFGDIYGRGSNHRFINCKIIKTGDNPKYHTLVFDGGDSVFNHVLLDCKFIGGATYNDVYWNNTQSKSNYRVDWTLKLKTDPGAHLIINDKNGRNVFTGSSGTNGKTEVVLTQSIIRPVEWQAEGDETRVQAKLKHHEEKLSPYTVVVEKNGDRKSKTVELTEPRTVVI